MIETSEKMITSLTDKYIPMIMKLGAISVELVRTGNLSICVITQYPDANFVGLVQAKIAEIKDQVTKESSFFFVNTIVGEVIRSA